MTGKKRHPHISVGSVRINAQAKKYIQTILKTNRVTYGSYTEKFEQEFARLHERKYGLFTNSGTSALQIAFHSLKEKYGWKDGSEVLIPSVTFVASVNVVLQNNLRPIFVDVDPQHFMIDPAQLENHITDKTVAIEPVHLTGLSAEMDPIMKIAHAHKLRVVEDSCEAMLVRYNNKPIGSYGDIACFSTYAAHIIVTGVGGLALTDDQDLKRIMRSLINHGRDDSYISIDDDNTTDKVRLRNIINRRSQYHYVGYSYRISEFEAALGCGALANWKGILNRRMRNGEYLIKGLQDLSEYLQLPHVPEDSQHSFMVFSIVVTKSAPFSREELIYFLEERGIETRMLLPLLNQPVYIKLWGNIERKFPVAAWINTHGFYIGSHQDLTIKDLDYVIEIFHDFFKKKKLSV